VVTREVAVKNADRKTTIKRRTPHLSHLRKEMGFLINTIAGKTGSRKDKCNLMLPSY